MPRFDPHNLPPSYPKADAGAPTQRRYGEALNEYRRVQGSPLTFGRFNLYSWYGRLYLAGLFAAMIGLAVAYVQLLLQRPPRLWDEWVLTFVAPLVPIVLPIVMCSIYLSHRRIYRLSHNLCPKCGYDLRESPDVCPECGQRS